MFVNSAYIKQLRIIKKMEVSYVKENFYEGERRQPEYLTKFHNDHHTKWI